MSGLCSTAKKPYVFPHNPNQVTTTSLNNYNNYGRTIGKTEKNYFLNKCPHDNQKNNIKRTRHYLEPRNKLPIKRKEIYPQYIVQELKPNNNIKPIKIQQKNYEVIKKNKFNKFK